MKLNILLSSLVVAGALRLGTQREQVTSTSRDIPACLIAKRSEIAASRNRTACEQEAKTCPSGLIPPQERLVVVGDVHGEGAGLREVLNGANITNPDGDSSCRWIEQNPAGTILIQVGDIVDRGAEAYEAWICLEELQNTATGNNKVIRLLGNHDIWWLEGKFHMVNREADTYEKVLDVVNRMKRGVLDGSVVGSYVHRIHDQPILFIHAGFRPKFIDMLKTSLSDASPEGMASYVNEMMIGVIQQCHDENVTDEFVTCTFDDDLFEAGPDRGGKGTDRRIHYSLYEPHLTVTFSLSMYSVYSFTHNTASFHDPLLFHHHSIIVTTPITVIIVLTIIIPFVAIGGPFWTDYHVIENAAYESTAVPEFIQIVGHTMAWCYSPTEPNVYPGRWPVASTITLVSLPYHYQQ